MCLTASGLEAVSSSADDGNISFSKVSETESRTKSVCRKNTLKELIVTDKRKTRVQYLKKNVPQRDVNNFSVDD